MRGKIHLKDTPGTLHEHDISPSMYGKHDPYHDQKSYLGYLS